MERPPEPRISTLRGRAGSCPAAGASLYASQSCRRCRTAGDGTGDRGCREPSAAPPGTAPAPESHTPQPQPAAPLPLGPNLRPHTQPHRCDRSPADPTHSPSPSPSIHLCPTAPSTAPLVQCDPRHGGLGSTLVPQAHLFWHCHPPAAGPALSPRRHRRAPPGPWGRRGAQGGTGRCRGAVRHLHPSPTQGPSPAPTPRPPEEGFVLVHEALVGAVVGVGEERGPAGGQAARLHREAVVLRRDEAAPRVLVQAGLVVPAVPVPGAGSGGVRHPQAARTLRRLPALPQPPLTSSCRCGRQWPRRLAGAPGRPRRRAWAGGPPARCAGRPLSAGRAAGPRGRC